MSANRRLLELAYLRGFNASGEGYNGEYPFQDRNKDPESDGDWVAERAEALDGLADGE